MLIALFFIGVIGSQPPITSENEGVNSFDSTVQRSIESNESNVKEVEPEPEPEPVCDGVHVTSGCVVGDIKYKTYVYYPAVPEKSHEETVVNYRQEIAGYCTLCNDGTYSPSCATGKGACSHHGGVAQWNAPRYRQVPEYTTVKVIDAPAQDAYFEKIVE